MILPGSPPSYTQTVLGNRIYRNRVGGIPDQYIELNCKTTFELENEKVVSWRWQGNDCGSVNRLGVEYFQSIPATWYHKEHSSVQDEKIRPERRGLTISDQLFT